MTIPSSPEPEAGEPAQHPSPQPPTDAPTDWEAQFDPVEELAEQLADLTLTLDEHTLALARHTTAIEALQTAVAATPQLDGDGDGAGEHERESEEGQGAPPFILLYDDGSQEEADELAALDDWVAAVLVPTYITQVTSRQPWCARWWEHPEAVARLHALWLAWQELTDEHASGHTGPSVWHASHLDPAMERLRSPEGPFQSCMINPRESTHRPTLPVPVERYQ